MTRDKILSSHKLSSYLIFYRTPYFQPFTFHSIYPLPLLIAFPTFHRDVKAQRAGF